MIGIEKFETGNCSDTRWTKSNYFVIHNVIYWERNTLCILSIFIGNGRIDVLSNLMAELESNRR